MSSTISNTLLVHRLLAKICCRDGNLWISLLAIIHFVAMAWDYVTSVTVANCFQKCGFFSPVVASPAPAEPTIAEWDQLNSECCLEDFVTANDDLVTCGVHIVEDIMVEVVSELAVSSDDGDNNENMCND